MLVVNAQNKAETRPIEIGQSVGAAWLVTKGLAAGDKVITEGLQKVKPDDTVRAVPAGSPPRSAPGPGGPPGVGQPGRRP